MKLVTAAEMRRLEQLADATGLSFSTMMENAGRAVADEILARRPVRDTPTLILVGPGNNGGDGLVAARHLHDAGAIVTVILTRPRTSSDENLRLLQDRHITCLLADALDGSSLAAHVASAHIIIDALLGTGVSRPVEGPIRQVLETLTAARNGPHPPGQLLVAVDLPSGLNADTGTVDPATPTVDLTVTFACPKRGHFLFPGADRIGSLVIADIGIPPALAADLPVSLATSQDVRQMLPPRPRNANKGTFGKVLVVGGSINYVGAPALAARAALRVGAGLVTLACCRSLHAVYAAQMQEITYLPLPEEEPGYIGAEAASGTREALQRYTAALIGPGLGQHSTTLQFLQGIVGRLRAPFVLDADGLNALASMKAERGWLGVTRGGVFTPHPGEMARLTGLSVEAIEADRIGVAASYAESWGQIVVLKGAYTVIAAADGRITINPFANAALATAGSGDVLAGMIAGFQAQGLTPYDAAVTAAYIHGVAGELASKDIGPVGVTAGDLISVTPRAIRSLMEPQAASG